MLGRYLQNPGIIEKKKLRQIQEKQGYMLQPHSKYYIPSIPLLIIKKIKW